MASKAKDDANAAKLLTLLGKIVPSLTKVAMGIPGRVAEKAGAATAAIATPLNQINSTVAPITAAFTGIVDQIMGLAGPLVSLVSKMDPTTVQLFEFAINDLMAVFGDILKPILKAITEVTRKLADTFKTMKPVFDPIIAAVVKIIGIFAKLIEPIARIMVPVLQLLAIVLDKLVIPILEVFVDKLIWLSKQVIRIINWMIEQWNSVVETKLGKALGLTKVNLLKFDDLKKESSQGQAIRETSRFSGVDIGKRTREAAFGQVAWQGKMLEKVEKILKGLEGIPADLKMTKEQLQKWYDAYTRQVGAQNAG